MLKFLKICLIQSKLNKRLFQREEQSLILFVFLSLTVVMLSSPIINKFNLPAKMFVLLDSISIDIESDYQLQYSTLKKRNSLIDSCIIVFDNVKKKIYSVNFDDKSVEKININRNLLSKSKNVYLENNDIYTLEDDYNTILKISTLNKTKIPYRLKGSRHKVSYYCLFETFEKRDSNFYLYKIPHYNMHDSIQNRKYFESNLFAKININTANETSIPSRFPSKYLHNNYYDFYPMVSIINDSFYVCSFFHTDTIFFYNKGLKNIKIPSEIGVQSPPYEIFKNNSLSKDMEYNTVYASNYKILLTKKNIFLLQKEASKLINERDELSTFETANKNVIIYDIAEDKFKCIAKVPNHLASQFSFKFKDKIIMPNIENNKLKLYVTNL